MKKFRKIMAILVAAIMIVAMAVPAWADPAFEITIQNAVVGETYTAYKIFSVTYSTDTAEVTTTVTEIPGTSDETSKHVNYAYTIDNDTAAFTVLTTNNNTYNSVNATGAPATYVLTTCGLTLTQIRNTKTYTVKPTSSSVDASQMAALATWLGMNTGSLTEANHGAATKTASAVSHDNGDYFTDTLTIDVSTTGKGYYFVNTTTGSFCSLDTTEPVAFIREKNDVPSVEKTVTDGEEASTSQDAADNSSTSVKIGDTVQFTITIDVSKGANKVITVQDTMSEGLTLDLSTFAFKKGNETIAANTGYWSVLYKTGSTVKNADTKPTCVTSGTTADSCTFVLTVTEEYVKTLAETDELTLTYSAELNKSATTGNTANTNTAILKYASQTTQPATTSVYTYKTDIAKTDDSDVLLTGATFTLWDAATGGNQYALIEDAANTGTYHIKESSDSGAGTAAVVPQKGWLTIKGLESNKSYYLQEESVPDGYFPLTARQEIAISTEDKIGAYIDVDSSETLTAGDKFDTTSKGVQVINQPGVELPSTGGMGTTVLYIVGGMLVILAGAYLFFSRKKTA